MSREVENLIMENSELLATKNALNVVKDDLIARFVMEWNATVLLICFEIKSAVQVDIHIFSTFSSILISSRVDELNGEIEILKEDLNSMSQGKTKSEAKVKELEAEVKQFKSDEEKRKNEEKEGRWWW